MSAHRTPCDQWSVAAGRKSLRRCSLTTPGKVCSLAAAARVLIITAHLCIFVSSQVYSLSEGMLEKLDLDDDGKSATQKKKQQKLKFSQSTLSTVQYCKYL